MSSSEIRKSWILIPHTKLLGLLRAKCRYIGRCLISKKYHRTPSVHVIRSPRPITKSPYFHSDSIIPKLPPKFEIALTNSLSSSSFNHRAKGCTLNRPGWNANLHCERHQSLLQISGKILQMTRLKWLTHPAYSGYPLTLGMALLLLPISAPNLSAASQSCRRNKRHRCQPCLGGHSEHPSVWNKEKLAQCLAVVC